MSDLSPEDQRLSDLMKNLKFLVADPNSSRQSIRQMLSRLGIPTRNVEAVEDFHQAMEWINASAVPNVIVADESSLGGPGFELLEAHRKKVPAGAVCVFILLVSKDSGAILANGENDAFDALIFKPFTFEVLKREFCAAMSRKLSPSPYEKALGVARQVLEAGQKDKALEVLMKVMKLDPAPVLACAYRGAVLLELGRPAEASDAFREGLKHKADHFKCGLGLVEALMAQNQPDKAYEAAQKFTASHRVPLNKVGDFVRLYVVNKKYEDLNGIFQHLETLGLWDERAANSLSAGFVVAGIAALKAGTRDQGALFFKRAEVIAKGNPKILKRIVIAMIESGMNEELKTLSDRLPPDLRDDPEIKMVEFNRIVRDGSANDSLLFSLDLIKGGFRQERVFEVAIRKSLEVGRRESVVEELVQQAEHAFPERKEFFRSLLPAKSEAQS